VAHLSLIFLSIGKPGVIWRGDTSLSFSDPTVSLLWVVNAMIFLLIAGSALTWLNFGVRKTIIQAANLEAERFYMVREQANLIMESRIGALGEMVAGISHEMNNPLGVIKANTETWRRAIKRILGILNKIAETGRVESKDENILKTLEQNNYGTHEATKRLGETLETLRNFSRLDEAELKHVDIHEALESSLALIPQEIMRNKQSQKQFGELPKVQAYAGRLNQVFMTLLTNAFEVIKDDGLVTITTKCDKDNAIIQISDTGPGLSEDQLKHFFDVRFETGATRVKAGFGMAACYNTITQHNGQISVESEIGKGTTFTIVLPIIVNSME
jgi:signal transduction histidine kinase